MAKKAKVGLWLIGVGGRVGSAVALGVSALRRKRCGTTGLVSELPCFAEAGLVAPGTFVVGGHEVRDTTILDGVQEAQREAGLFTEELVRATALDLRSFERHVRSGTLLGVSPGVADLAEAGRGVRDKSAAGAVDRLGADLRAFREGNKLDHVVVVNLSSVEPGVTPTSAHRSWSSLSRRLSQRGGRALPASSLYGLAAIENGCAFIDFTPSTGLRLPALRERANELGGLYGGSDGKTGETLVKSALAPMFALRHLNVLSWSGQNLLGNRDGQVLRDPKTRASKLAGKDAVVPAILGRATQTRVSIEFVRSLDDWKVAWDYIHFAGFLGTKMAMQFTWQGCDSMLAAPLVIDLARLAALELQRGSRGAMEHLGFFFKNPIGAGGHDFCSQFRRLVEHVTGRTLP